LNRTILIKLVNDLVMTILMVVVMAYHITGNTIHELIGGIVVVLFIVHNILNRRWYKVIFKGKLNIQRILKISVNLLFLVSMLVVILTSIPISREILPYIRLEDDTIFRQIHVLTGYWGFILMAIHIGVSWGTIINAMKKMTGITQRNRIRTIALRVIAVLIVVYGVQTSFERELGTKLIVYYPFGFWNNNESIIQFLIDYLSIIGIYIGGTHYVLKFVHKKENAKTQI
jgi:hypothetical protein